MPWSYPNNVPSVAKNKTAAQQKACVKAANQALRDGKSEQDAIFACIGAMKNVAKGKKQEADMPTDDIQELGAKENAAQQARSKRHGISIRDDGNVTKPSKWSHVADSQWGDPVNYLYPVPDKAHAANAKSRFTQNKGEYDSKSRAVVRRRLNRLLRKYGLDPIGSDDDQENTFDNGFFVGEIFLQNDELPEDDPHRGMVRIPAARRGQFNRRVWFWKEVIELDDELFESFIDNWRTDVIGQELAIDQSHDIQGRALGWVRDIQVEEDDGFVIYAEPTEEGRGILGESLKYASLWYTDNFKDQETGIEYGPTLLGCAATNIPFIHRQNPMSVVMSADGQMVPPVTTNNFILVYDQSGQLLNQFGPALTVSATEESLAGLPADDDIQGGTVMPEDTVNETPEQPQAPPATSIRVGDHTFTPEQIQEMIDRQLLLEKQVKEARISEICDKALGRGVPPVVVEAARQVLTAADMDATETIELRMPTGDGLTKKVNYFGAVSHLLDMVPGRLGEVTYGKGNDNQPPKKRQAENLYDPAANDDMTPEEAEELARKRRKELGIKTQQEAEL